MKVLVTLLVLVLILPVGMPASAGTLYRWVDRNGNLHFTDSPASIPSEYRNQVDIDEFGETENKKTGESSAQDTAKRVREAAQSVKNKEMLSQYEIPYIAYEGRARRIIIPVTLNGNVTANMALDTGAPGMIINPQLAERLGLFESDEGALAVTAGGIGGTAPAVWTIIDTVQIGAAGDRFVPTTITEIKTAAFEGLIGMDFMASYSVHIDPRRKVVVFSELQRRPNIPGGHDEEWWRTQFRTFSSLRNRWKEYRDMINQMGSQSTSVFTFSTEELKMAQEFSDRQYREADKLFYKLKSYATEHAVPMSWREY